MKVLIVNMSDISGGAARAAYRLHRALLDEGVESKMLVQDKKSDDFTVIDLAKNRWQKSFNKVRPIIDQLPVKLYKKRTKTLFSPLWFDFNRVLDAIEEIKPDIVHLHWICGGMIRIEDLTKIKQPLVWSLHDNWAFTGGCHIKWECDRFKESCGICPRLGSHKENDLSRTVWRRKKKTFSIMRNLTIVGLSSWISNCSKESSLLKDKNHVNIPNPIDTNLFKPFDRKKARELWSLPRNKKLVLFGAMSATSDINKGFKELSEALKQLRGENIEFVVFGSGEPQNKPDFEFKTHYVGHLHDDVSLVALYNAVDVMVVPSVQEAFGQTASESMACATPVVAFGHTGLLDIIDHKTNGYLAKPFDSGDLAKGIEWVLNNENYESLCKNAREKVVREFDSKVVAKKYIELYNEVLHG